MFINVTQGHESGIGLEVFFKTCLLLSSEDLSKIRLYAYAKSVEKTLDTLGLPFEISDKGVTIAGSLIEVVWQKKVKQSESFTALIEAMNESEKKGILFTLPTSKDQFPGYPGHTEFFRSHYKKPDLGMFFSSPSLQVLLLTDHVAVSDLSKVLTEEVIYARVKTALTTLKSWNWPTKRILISGFNPHAGENGLIGSEDKRVEHAIKRLSRDMKMEVSGPYPGDTMLLEKNSKDDLLIYLFHDQGLGVFKGLQGFIGSNITLGLPYPRFSPDHGTSFGLFGKNAADYRGCQFAMKEALGLLKKVEHGKNSSHQSKSSQS